MEPSLPQLILHIKLERSSGGLTSLIGLVVVEELTRAVGLWEEKGLRLEGRSLDDGISRGSLCRRWCGCRTREGGWGICGNCGRSGKY